MKLHLPVSLRAALLALFGSVVAGYTVQAASMHSAATLVTYTDFGQNCGRYIAGDGGNALLQYIRQQEGGIAITYTDGRADYVISNEQGMIDFSAGYNRSIATAISPTIIVTVGHNGEQSSNFTSDVYGIGGSHCINYKSVSISGSSVFSNAYNDGRYVDYRISRQSKIFTDITPVQACSSTQEARDLVSGTNMFYHSGDGYHQYPGLSLPYQAYVYETGGIIAPLSLNDTSAGGLRVGTTFNGVNNTNPLPYAALAGDSGSPVYVYDAEEGVYKLWGCTALSDGTNATYLSYTNKYQEALNSFNKSVDMSSVSAVDGVNTVYLNAVDEVAGSQSDGSNSTTLYAGKIKDAAGNVLTTHIGLQNGLSTWSDLSGVKNNQNWYNYGNGYVAQSNADLYFTENLLFSSSAAQNAVVLNATVDLGVGYAEFSASGNAPVSYTVSSAAGGNYMLNSAGYLVNENVSLHLQLTSSDKHMYEWRKIGAGDLYIEGSGDNNILLNLGGSGTTYLKRTDGGYAAYNVLVNNGAKVVIDDIGQIERDFTFGNKGGVLDMNGQSMDWYTTGTSESIANAGFTINALTEDAVIANNKGSSSLVYRQSGDTTFLGSFRDSSDSSLKIQYAGGGTWVLNSVHTNLQNDNSGLQVDNGKVVLRGTNTIHAEGSANGVNSNRYTNANDWHYADAAMDVTVKGGATFELGSHARLTGDVTVESGGIYVMREGVKYAQEYVEGGQQLEDVSKYAAFYGHKGDTVLNGGTLKVEYSSGVTANNTYAGNISGTGNMSVDLKDWSAIFTLSGDNSFTGTKTLVCGGLIADSTTALGDTSTNKWVIQEDAWIASHKENGAQLLEHIDTSSTGTLVLSADSEQLNIAGYNDLFIGAEAGKTVQYGTLGTTEALNAADGAWRLGGGGGTLVVNYVLSGANDLLLGATENSTGVVHLTNQGNSFTGNIIFSGEGVQLTYEDGALGSAIVDLSYGNASELYSVSDVMRISIGSEGMVLVDNFSDNAISLQNHPSLTVGVAADKTWSGEFWLAENQAYRFGAINGATFTVNTALESGRDLIIDAQGSSGGKVALDASAITGQIAVMGRNDDGAGGDITLVISQDDALSAASGVSVQNGGILDLGGTSHVLNNVEVQAGGRINGTSAGNLIFNITEDSSVAGRLQLGTVEKTGAADLALSADAGSSWSLLTISEGAVTVGSGSLGSNIKLAGGVLAAGSGAAVNYSGTIFIADGATECIRGGAWKLTGAENIVNNGTLNLQNSKLYFNSTSAQTLRGTLNVVGSSELHSIESNGADYMQKQLAHIHVASGNELKIVDHTWNSIWHIDELTGDGTFKWNPQNTHYYSSSVIIDGDGGFSGTLDFYRQHDPGYADTAATYNKNYQAYLQIDSEEAISRATVNLVGTWASYVNRDAYATLALNDERIKIGGLNATGHALAHVMAGAAPSAVSRNAPDSTRSTTLEITGSGNYEYKGSIGTAADKTGSYGVSIEMTGTGTQLFNGSTVVVNDVAALNGTLNFNSSGLYIKGDVTVAQGASLKLNASYTLDTGHTLNVVAGAGGMPAVLNNSLVLNGGSLKFATYDSTTAVLSTQGVSLGSDFTTLNVSFGNTMSVREGVCYLLASGDWSAVAGKLTCDIGEYLTATLGATNSGLQVTFALADGYSVWRGDESVLQAGAKVLFGSLGGSNEVALSAPASIGAAYFDNLDDVTVSSANGAGLTANLIEKHGTGALVINNTVNGDTLRVAESSLLTGSGRLAVDTMEISRGAQASISKLNVAVESAITGDGVLRMEQDSTLQVGSSVAGNVQLVDGSTLVAVDSSVSTNLTLGESGADSNVSLRMGNSSGVVLTGSVAVQGNTTLSVQGSGALQFNSEFNKLAALELKSGVNLALSSELSTHLVLDGGSASLSGNNNKILDGDVTVKNGGTLTFTGTGADIIDYNKSGKTLTVAGGSIDFGSTRQTMGGWTLKLSDGATITGAGNATHGAMDFNVNNSTIYATSGSSTISAVTRLRNGNNLNYDVSDGATLTVSGRHHSSGSNTMGSITKLGSGVLALSGDALNLLTSASYIAVEEGKLDLTAAGSSANLSKVRGAGTIVLQYGLSGNGTAFNFSGLTGDVELKSGRILLNESTFGSESPDFLLTSSNSQLVFNGNGTVVNSNVHISANTTDFHVNSGKSGTIGGDITGNSLVKQGGGSLTVGGNMKLNSMLSTRAGQVILTGAQNTVANVDCSMGSTAEGTLRLAQDARLEVTGNIWSRNNTGILLDSGAELDISGKKLTITNRAEEGTASLAATTSTDPGEYTINRTGYQISNAHVTYTGGDATINNLLTNSSIENACSGTLKVNNADNTLSGVYATGGSIKLFADAELDLKELEIANSLSISAYSQLSERAEQEARLNISGTANFGMGVTLNADLVMKSGATLKVADTVQMGSDVRLESGLKLAGAQYDTLNSLKVGEKVTLFSGVDSLFLGNSTVASDAITLDDRVLANEYFSNLADSYFLVYDTAAGVGQGELSIAVIPEPTSATLSILALAGLAARRRRK